MGWEPGLLLAKVFHSRDPSTKKAASHKIKCVHTRTFIRVREVLSRERTGLGELPRGCKVGRG